MTLAFHPHLWMVHLPGDSRTGERGGRGASRAVSPAHRAETPWSWTARNAAYPPKGRWKCRPTGSSPSVPPSGGY